MPHSARLNTSPTVRARESASSHPTTHTHRRRRGLDDVARTRWATTTGHHHHNGRHSPGTRHQAPPTPRHPDRYTWFTTSPTPGHHLPRHSPPTTTRDPQHRRHRRSTNPPPTTPRGDPMREFDIAVPYVCKFFDPFASFKRIPSQFLAPEGV
jgi:hypothetical protein